MNQGYDRLYLPGGATEVARGLTTEARVHP